MELPREERKKWKKHVVGIAKGGEERDITDGRGSIPAETLQQGTHIVEGTNDKTKKRKTLNKYLQN